MFMNKITSYLKYDILKEKNDENDSVYSHASQLIK